MSQRVLKHLLILFFLIPLFTACSSLLPADAREEVPGPGSDQGADSSGSAESDAEDPGDSWEAVSCFHAQNYVLAADHTLTVNEAETSLTHILSHGGIALQSEFNQGGHDAVIRTISPQQLTFEYLGTVGVCSVDAGGTMTLSAEGYCDQGIVYLTITENWSKTEGTMKCEDANVPFSVPGQAFTHSGENGQGEEFLVTDDPAGHTVLRPFGGGEGYHSWTLTMDIAPEPLVPLD